jgi:hypothetical protein
MKALLPRARRRAAWTEGTEAPCREGVDDPGGERQLGADDGEVDSTRRREREQPGTSSAATAQFSPSSGRTGVAGRAEELRRRTLCEIFQQRACSRPPPPTTRIRMG